MGTMASKYEKNYTEDGYLMQYIKGITVSPYKNWVLQFKIELPEILPLIWRRIHVPSNYNFWDLHVAIQDAMGWSDYHLHHFEIRKKGKSKEDHVGIPDFDKDFDLPEVFPGWEIPLTTYFSNLGINARYLYDYGDNWWHLITLEGYIAREKKVKYPICFDGERACPPEDCGGESGYYNLLQTLSNPESENYEEYMSWIGESWDPEVFEKNDVVFDNPFKRWNYSFLKK